VLCRSGNANLFNSCRFRLSKRKGTVEAARFLLSFLLPFTFSLPTFTLIPSQFLPFFSFACVLPPPVCVLKQSVREYEPFRDPDCRQASCREEIKKSTNKGREVKMTRSALNFSHTRAQAGRFCWCECEGAFFLPDDRQPSRQKQTTEDQQPKQPRAGGPESPPQGAERKGAFRPPSLLPPSPCKDLSRHS